MIFQHTWEKVLSGEKTQTRRLVKRQDITGGSYKAGYRVSMTDGSPIGVHYKPFRFDADGKYLGPRRKWIPGRTYAVQPSRTEKGIARIRITGVRRQDVRRISQVDARAEGFSGPEQFLQLWMLMHLRVDHPDLSTIVEDSWQCPAAAFHAWVIEFELVKDGGA
jgi:hypothetical protein